VAVVVSPAVARAAADKVVAAVRVVADHPVDSVAGEAVETADAVSAIYKKR